ncbi:NAD(P)-binding domain-containing protein [Streptomyces albiaxialis]|uniref:NAD(P)-binding domain-containing protein n=2 Tax=Streptomyces albiaxialis TaxID=329523 RepID=A0ABP5H6S5_9ACTN
MATALGGAWRRAGHEVLVAGRDRHREAAAYGDVVLAALPADVAPEVVKGLGEALAGRTVLDCTNPIVPVEGEGLMLSTGGVTSVARRMAEAAPHAHVVKAFNLCHESVWTREELVYEGAPLAVPYCADDADAGARTAELITSMGCAPLACGGLARAAYLEATGAFAIGVWWSGGETRHVFPTPAEAVTA